MPRSSDQPDGALTGDTPKDGFLPDDHRGGVSRRALATEADCARYLPFWESLSPSQQARTIQGVSVRTTPAGTLFGAGTEHDCLGFISVMSGRLRVYTISSDARELTLFRLSDGDHCLISASCAMGEVVFSTSLSAEVDTTYLLVPSDDMHDLIQRAPGVAVYANTLMAQRLSQVMWLINQLLSDKLDVRIAMLLLEESRLSGCRRIRITHEQIAHHLGSAREVITRVLRYLADEGYVSLSRGMVTIEDASALGRLAATSQR